MTLAELRAAAERLHKFASICAGLSRSWYTADEAVYKKFRKTGVNRVGDEKLVAAAYLADHPADDDAPLTPPAFLNEGWEREGGEWHSPADSGGRRISLDFHDSTGAGDVYRLAGCGGLPRATVTTVGQLRRLCAVFGVHA